MDSSRHQAIRTRDRIALSVIPHLHCYIVLKNTFTHRLKIEMKNAPSFLGYSQLSAEITAGAVDHREQIDRKLTHPLLIYKDVKDTAFTLERGINSHKTTQCPSF
jgi:isopenicillin N synthase-like dioxygenase